MGFNDDARPRQEKNPELTEQEIYISVVSPVYGNAPLLEAFVDRVKKALVPLSPAFEIILIDDRSPDDAWPRITSLHRQDPRVKGFRLSRNFGQHYAITAGLDQCRGEWVVVMDSDLQDRPEEIPALLQAVQQQQAEVALARREVRRDRPLKRFFTWLFYRLLSYLTGSKIDASIANFGIYHRPVVAAICRMRESIRFFPSMVRWVGFRTVTLNVEHAERPEGESSYNFRKLLNLAIDIVLAYSDKPIRIAVKLGLLISSISFLFAFITLIRALAGDIKVLGYASLIISIWFFSGLIISFLGVIGLYLGKTFEGVKARPLYIISEKTT